MKNPLHCFLLLLLTAVLLQVPAGHCLAQVQDTIISTPNNQDEEEVYDEDSEAQTEETESSGTNVLPYSRTIPSDTIAAFRRNTSFAYMARLDSLLKEEERRRQAVPEKPRETVVEPEGPSLWESGIVKFLLYVAAIGLVGFVLYRLFIGQGLFFRNKTRHTMPAIELEETPDESDLEKALRTALGRKDYRLGVRYLFLMTLQWLGEQGVVQLATDKTNYQYVLELQNKSYANQFAQLSLQYEYVWFGNFPIQQQQFETIQQQHQQFLKLI